MSSNTSYTQVPLSLRSHFTHSKVSSLLHLQVDLKHVPHVCHDIFPNTNCLVLLVQILGFPTYSICSFPHACYQNGLFYSIRLSNFSCHLEASSSFSFATKLSLFISFYTVIFLKNHIGFHNSIPIHCFALLPNYHIECTCWLVWMWLRPVHLFRTTTRSHSPLLFPSVNDHRSSENVFRTYHGLC